MVNSALFVFDSDNWCSVFRDVAHASAELEAADTDVGEYVVFDQDGTVFEVWADGLDVRLRPSNEHDVGQLQERLGRFLNQWHIECPSADMVDIGNAILEAEWESRWPKRPRWVSSRLYGEAPPKL